MVPFFFIIFIVVVVLFFLIRAEMRTIEYFRYQHFIDTRRTEIVSLLSQAVSSVLDRKQLLGNLWFFTSKSSAYLTEIDIWLNGEQSLSRSYQIPIGMAYPELAHVPGIFSQWTGYRCLGLLGLTIHCVHVIN